LFPLFGCYMAMNIIYINLVYGLIAFVLLAGSFWMKSGNRGWLFYIFVLTVFSVSSVIMHTYFLAIASFLALIISFYRYRLNNRKNKPIEVIFICDHDDLYLQHFLDYYRADISKHFPAFDFKIEEEFLVALLVSDMETVGLIIAEIKNPDTLRICVDFLLPKYSNSQLAKTFYQCELRCIDFLGYHCFYIEPQSEVHNNYLERIGFRLVNGKYINQF